MEYISVGTKMEQAYGGILRVSHCGQKFRLTKRKAGLWQIGSLGFASADRAEDIQELRELAGMGIVVLAKEKEKGKYRALTRCIICPTGRLFSYMGLSGKCKTVMKWLSKAGLCLTMAELVYLMDRGIEPSPELLGVKNRQALVEAIYTRETVFDSILENEMETALACNETVEIIEALLKRKRVFLL